MQPIRLAPCVAASLLVAGSALAEPTFDPAYRDHLIEVAIRQKLSERPAWRALLHYEERSFGRFGSPATTPRFFAAAGGASEPAEELAATLAAFFDPDPPAGADDPGQCAFIARFHWLDRQLDFDPERLPRIDCENYRRWRERLPADRLTLVFPESFIDNPASMFGHTLLRLDSGDEASKLLGYAVDFTGDIGDDGPIAYLVKGPVGLYPGYFAVGPYYQKLKRYAEWENRDIWEYTLDLDPEEIDFLLMHLWELRGITFPYYFFDDNCSYRLLRLLEAARPESRLTRGFGLSVLPIDTVRAVARAGWVRDVHYRASPATELQAVAARLPHEMRVLARKIALGEIAPDASRVKALAPADQAAVIGLAYESLLYDFLAGRREQDESRALSRRILIARSRLGRQPETPVPRPQTRPDHGHETARISLAGGVRDGDGYLELRFRPALHGFMDPPGGHARGNRVSVLDTRIRYLPEKNRVRVEEVVLLDVASLSPRDSFLRPLAWKVDTGLRTRLRADSTPGDDFDEKPVWRTGAGIGLAASPVGPMLLYAMGDTLLDVGPGLEHDVSFGPGASAGVYLDGFGERLRTHLFGAVTRFVAGDTTTWYRVGLEQRLTLASQLALQLETSANRIDGDTWYEAGFALALYF